MEKEELSKRIERCRVQKDTLQIGVSCGAYPSLEAALDLLDAEYPLGENPNSVVGINRMMRINDDIDQVLFKFVEMTSAWTWLEDHEIVFVLNGPESRGTILHQKVLKETTFRLEPSYNRGSLRFLRFEGDKQGERYNKKGRMRFSALQFLSRKLKCSVSDLRETFEALVRTCDDPGWTHAEFPFLYPGSHLEAPLRLLKRHGYLLHKPHMDRAFL